MTTLRLSRIDHREIHRKAEIFPLGEQLRRAVLQLEPRWTEAGLSRNSRSTFRISTTSATASFSIRCGVNLLENAVKFSASSAAGASAICLAAASGHRHAVTAWDTGCGMDAETLPAHFRAVLSGRDRPPRRRLRAGSHALQAHRGAARRNDLRGELVPERAAASASRCRQRPQNSCKETP